jgi:hypothetical protein
MCPTQGGCTWNNIFQPPVILSEVAVVTLTALEEAVVALLPPGEESDCNSISKQQFTAIVTPDADTPQPKRPRRTARERIHSTTT